MASEKHANCIDCGTYDDGTLPLPLADRPASEMTVRELAELVVECVFMARRDADAYATTRTITDEAFNARRAASERVRIMLETRHG